jgi:DNA-binding MarR family transcriptional regulator
MERKRHPPSANDTLGFLVADAARALRRVWVPMIGRHGVTAGMFPFLRMISEHDGLTFRELAEAVHMRGPTTVNIVKDMEAAGLVRRRRSGDDARKVHLHLTAKGRRAWTAVVPEVVAINRQAELGLTATEAATLKQLLRRVRANLDMSDAEGD